MTLSQRLLTAFLTLMCLLPSGLAGAHAQEAPELEINSSRYIVVDAATGQVYAQRDANQRVAIASLTKVFTAVQAMEMAPLDTPITTTDSDLRRPDGDYFGTSGTLMGFGEGETYTLEDMLYGMLLPSGNDAALAIARTLGARPGDTDQEAVQHFMDLLNQRIADMGLDNTHLENPHGWGVDGHYSTAADVAAFNRFATEYLILMEIMGTRSYTTSNGLISVTNTNRSLSQYPSVEAGKTGYDDDAGWCLINIARRDETELIAVTLDGIAPGDWYNDNATLLDYGFDQHAAFQGSGEAFQGDIVQYVDPSVANIERSVSSTASYVPGAGSTASNEPSNGQPVMVRENEPGMIEASAPQSIAEGSFWVAAVSAIGVLGIRGLLTLRSRPVTGVRSRSRTPSEPKRAY